MKEKLKSYIAKFNREDTEYYSQDIPNASAEEWLTENIPLIDIPDAKLEQIYYFRWWVFRKHIQTTPDGLILTEFLPKVCWSGTHNSIIAAVGHHLAEAKWLRHSKKLVEEYVRFWLEEKSATYLYSTWILYALYEYSVYTNDFSFGVEHLSLLMNYYNKVEEEHMTECGLMWSIDDNDAMEYSISGSTEAEVGSKGLRPTLNSYMAANAFAISEFAKKAGKEEIAQTYWNKYVSLKDKMNDLLWDKDFYKAIHSVDFQHPSIDEVPPEQNVRELIGYIPWCFHLAPKGREIAFLQLKQPDGFLSPYGLTTAEKRHPRYLYEVNHVCLWNGYIWPFATTQVLDAMIALLQDGEQNTVTKEDFYDVLSQYASMHTFEKDGKTVCWIDEVRHPETNEWSCRNLLEQMNWPESAGGVERGKDYNHSTFCNLILGGLLGISAENGEIHVNPQIPDSWEHFKVENLWVDGSCYRITYDKHAQSPITIERI